MKRNPTTIRTPASGPFVKKIVYRCTECGRKWTVTDDPNEWVYGHDCEV
jgi:hypothetical protein